jgi:xanthine dehydrogenase YagR molybdenum-binding subunit
MRTTADGGIAVGSNVAELGAFLYGWRPKLLCDYDVVSNTSPGTPFRGPGGPPFAWALEQAVDEIAERTQTDAITLRRRWDRSPKRRALYDWAAALPLWRQRARSGSSVGRFLHGVGFSASSWFYFVDSDTCVTLHFQRGRLVASASVQDMGTGSRSVLAVALEQELGLDRSLIDVRIGRSGPTHGPTSGGSRTTTSLAPAASAAAARLRRELGLRHGAAVDWPAVLTAYDGLEVEGRRPADRYGFLLPVSLNHLRVGRGLSGAVHVTEVEVDTLFGTTRVLRVFVGIAVGRIWAPDLARNQVEGAVVQGLGYALYEERHLDPSSGLTLTTNMDDYRIPGIADTPETTVHFEEAGWGHVPGGGVGLGEVATLGMAASVGNAIYNATGWRPLDLPVRPDRLLEGLRSR